LHGDEKTLLHLIPVHRGGASLPSLLALGADHGFEEKTVTYLLGALVDKSIVSVAFPEEEARYDLLDTVRDYTLERLADTSSPTSATPTPNTSQRWPSQPGQGCADRAGWPGRNSSGARTATSGPPSSTPAKPPIPTSRSGSEAHWAGTSRWGGSPGTAGFSSPRSPQH
jgi:hypothetical protein